MPYLTKESVYQDARIFAQHIVIAIDCLDQSRAMVKIFCDPKFSSRYKDASHFFRTAYHAMRFRFEIEIDKLFDTKSKSFDSFKNHLIQNNMLSNEAAIAYKNAKREAKRDLKQIHTRRNKIQAHSDAKTFNDPDVFSEEHPFCEDNVRKLLICMLNICNRIIFTYTEIGIAQLYGLGNSDDFVRLFGCETDFDKQNREFYKSMGIKQ